jgi:DNA-binding HxlR family transcriptional regulator
MYPQVPPKVEYSLTEKGNSIHPILEMMCDWGREYVLPYIFFLLLKIVIHSLPVTL